MGAMFSSCEGLEDIIGGGYCMYGTPTMDYEISGKVVDAESGKAIEGILVSRPWKYDDYGVLTDNKGKFTICGQEFPNDTLHVQATDIDGSYQANKIVVSLKQVEKGDGAWYNGKFGNKNEVEIKMDKASE